MDTDWLEFVGSIQYLAEQARIHGDIDYAQELEEQLAKMGEPIERVVH